MCVLLLQLKPKKMSFIKNCTLSEMFNSLALVTASLNSCSGTKCDLDSPSVTKIMSKIIIYTWFLVLLIPTVLQLCLPTGAGIWLFLLYPPILLIEWELNPMAFFKIKMVNLKFTSSMIFCKLSIIACCSMSSNLFLLHNLCS